ncbi:F0F1 ATP synthase subunit B family protein [Singulisphaera acidiphila]|uniref:ATP synthase subunit b n=1 Tax=Singulisphaera acidiphila (strain ATCC BAA-1392 / DSM 18658 / VKM B-2454 / MOB10) TaxID=886293 RepID=L0DCL7_SINAD|nr:F0F1 ATP synthase subunit delta [Singulisphaera acidiphila]AGA26376.1 alternate F1F0 ATPase, F0 subunit B [Singulisphaera acidiphila DSM 18658]
MLINWFTVVAQAINFLILVWLLKRFLYKPILHAIDEREKGIATVLAEAEAKKTEAQKERDDFQHKNEAFDQERASLLKKATEDASAERQQLLDEARKDADSLRAKRQAALRAEQLNLSQDLSRWTQKQVFAITRKTLTDLAGASLEERMGDVFVQRVRALTGAAKEQLETAFETSNHTVSVHSAFDLAPAQQSAIESAVKETFAPDAHVQFETSSALVSGIELSINGYKIAWSIADYLATLEKSAGELLHEDAKPEPKPDAKEKPEAGTKSKSGLTAETKCEPKRTPEPVPSAPKADH